MELADVVSDRPRSIPFSTISSISALEILDADDRKTNGEDNNKPIEVDTPRLKRTTEEVPTLKKKLTSFSEDFEIFNQPVQLHDTQSIHMKIGQEL